MTSKQSASYSVEEYILLCHVYLNVSQNPIIGINQSGDQFWGRVKTEFDKSTIASSEERPRRSLQTRMSTILTACSKLRGCVNQIENKNPSGASEQDIVINQAKMLLTQEVNYSKSFKFDHVWPILKGIEKLSNKQTTRVVASQEESQHDFSSPSLQDESSPTPGMNSFDLNTSGEEDNFSKSRRPMGVKKAKRKQQCDDQFKKMMEQNERLIKAIAKGTSERNEIQRKKVEVQRMKEENKILFADLNSITDPACREYIQNQRALIMSERSANNPT
ncbi:Glutathione S-transferase T3 [Cardamine amara subsp. amara]|uniref:Glutathione S-transferase T3 n=1 Tax=Cardamine amara subsp. amara TaxID=228776 RepID=A0ABD1BAZ2_CARAN